jgi:hypothetical protein
VKTRGLVKANRSAARVIRTGAEPTWAYGVEAFGLADASLSKLRSATASALAFGGVQACPIMTVRIGLGPSGDPLCVATRASILWWVDTWTVEKSMKSIFRKTWEVCWGKIVNQGEILWRKVTGPIGTAIANLTRIGWSCESPEVWVDQGGTTWTIGTDRSIASIAELSDAIRGACVQHLDGAASRHRGGDGIELGVDLTVTRKHLAKLSRDHNHAGRGLLQTAVTGGLWLNARVHDSHPEVEATCAVRLAKTRCISSMAAMS